MEKLEIIFIKYLVKKNMSLSENFYIAVNN